MIFLEREGSIYRAFSFYSNEVRVSERSEVREKILLYYGREYKRTLERQIVRHDRLCAR